MKGSGCRLDGCGLKLGDVELEEQVLSWIHKQRTNMLRVSRKLNMFKAKYIYNEKCVNDKAMNDAFIASNDWLVKFMPRTVFCYKGRQQ